MKQATENEALFYSLPLPMLLLDENLLVVKANNAFSHSIGKQSISIVNKRIGSALNCVNRYNSGIECGQGKHCDICEMQAILRETIATGKSVENAEIQYGIMTGDVQTNLNLRVSAVPIAADNMKRIAVMLVNLDEFRKSADVIEELLGFFRNTFDNSISFVWWINSDGTCAYANGSWLRFTGRTLEEELGFGWMDRLHHGDKAVVQESEQEIKDESSEYNIEFRALRFDGEYRWINVIGRPIYVSKGKASGYIGIGFDITDKRLEREVLEKYRLLSESVDDIILFLDKDGNILEANNSAVASYGYTHQELLSLNVSNLRVETCFTKNQLEKSNTEGITYEIYHKRREDSKFPVEVKLNSAYVNEEELFIAVIRDISDRKKAEQRMKESEQRYFSLFTNMSEAFLYGRVVCDNKGVPIDYIILEVNSAFENMTRLRRENILNRRAAEVNPMIKTSEPNLIEVCGQVALTGKEVKFELNMNSRGKFYAVSSYSPKPGDFVNVLYDITEQKNAEMEVKKLSSALEQSYAIAIITDTKGFIEYVNPKYTQVTGYSFEEVRGKHIMLTSHEKMKKKFFSEMLTPIVRGEAWSGELLNKKKNGERYWVSASISPIKDKNGVITHYSTIQEDITLRKTLEKELKLKNKTLEKTIEELKTMQKMMIQQEKLAGIGQLAAGVAHEINNPLGFVISNFDILQKYSERLYKLINALRMLSHSLKRENYSMAVEHLQLVDELEEKIDFVSMASEIKDIFSDCNQGLQRIKNIVSGLGIFVRSNQPHGFESYDINAGIESTLLVAQNKLKYHAVVIKELGDIPAIQAVGDQINQVLLNIIVNAVQAIEAKNQKSKGTIRVKTYYDNDDVCCEISDDGIGISEENQKRIFNPFFTTKLIGEGTGLGLSISYNIVVNVHKGQLMVKSEEGRGTRFTIKLPIDNE